MTKNKINKIDIVNNLSQKTGFSLNLSKKIINDLINVLIQNIKEGDLILKNIGSFKIINKKERLGRNHKTNESHIISSRKTISFTASKKILNELNKFV